MEDDDVTLVGAGERPQAATALRTSTTVDSSIGSSSTFSEETTCIDFVSRSEFGSIEALPQFAAADRTSMGVVGVSSASPIFVAAEV